MNETHSTMSDTFNNIVNAAGLLNDSALFHMKIVENPYMTVPGDPIYTKRTWKQRLFSRPWKPFNAYDITIPHVPSSTVLTVPNGQLIMHPEVAAQLKRSMGRL